MDQKSSDRGDTAAQSAARGLGDRQFVSLAEALTWIAFGDAMTADDLRIQVEGHRPPITHSPKERLRKFFAGEDNDVPEIPGLGHFENRQSGLDRLTEAWDRLRAAVYTGAIKMHGRYTATSTLDEALRNDVDDLNWHLLEKFKQIDVFTGGIMRPTKNAPDLVLWGGTPQWQNRMADAFDHAANREGYLLVEVERTGLESAFSGDALLRPYSTELQRVPTRTGDPGRPSKGYQIYAAEHSRRCDAGEAHLAIAKEAQHLVAWFSQKHPSHDPISSGTVTNRIRKRHNQYKAHKNIDTA